VAAKVPESDGLLSGGPPGVGDAWYIMLNRWGTMTFEQVLQPAIDLAENARFGGFLVLPAAGVILSGPDELRFGMPT
jgi:gamma-glutamyltranspeptidase